MSLLRMTGVCYVAIMLLAAGLQGGVIRLRSGRIGHPDQGTRGSAVRLIRRILYGIAPVTYSFLGRHWILRHLLIERASLNPHHTLFLDSDAGDEATHEERKIRMVRLATTRTGWLPLLAALIVLFAAAPRSFAGSDKDIVDTAASAGNFSTLVAAVKAADLVDTLKGDGPFTVFAPTDEAFQKLPAGTLDDLLKPENKAKLQSILTYHVVPGKVMASQVADMTSAKTVNGQEIRISKEGGGVKVDEANVVKTDIETSNGVIHVIDAVIMPQE